MASFEDTRKRIDALLMSSGLVFQRRFAETISAIRDLFTLQELERLLASGRVEEALAAADQAASKLASAYTSVYVLAAEDTARFVAGKFQTIITFDQTNARAVDQMRSAQLRLIREFTQGQRDATRSALIDGIQRGLNPRDQARAFRASIGLTTRQIAAVNNYRRLLQEGSAEALMRELRDARFDRTVQRAVSGGSPLTSEQIDRMVERYREGYLRFRSETIARTESLTAVHQGADETYLQAITSGILDSSQLTQQWHVKRDGRQRDSHDAMQGQTRPMGEAFVSGLGNHLKYPGDVEAPAEDRLECRCAKTTRYSIDQPA